MRSINLSNNLTLAEYIDDIPEGKLSDVIASLDSLGWTFQAVNAKRGYCSYTEKLITIPAFAFEHKDKEFLLYYIAHEVAHAVTRQGHTVIFAKFLKSLIPSRLYHYEEEYKPRAAKAAGMSYNPLDDM